METKFRFKKVEHGKVPILEVKPIILHPKHRAVLVDLQASTILDGDSGERSSRIGTLGFDPFEYIHSVCDLSKNDVLAVQPRSLTGANKD